MKNYFVAYVTTGIVFLVLDAIWLGTMAPRLYRPLIGDMLLDGFRIVPAVVFYLLYLVGIMVFVTTPAFASGRWSTAALYGALFGFFAYATYDLTSHAVLKNWSTTVTVVDIGWGTVLTAASGAIGFAVTRWLVGGPGA